MVSLHKVQTLVMLDETLDSLGHRADRSPRRGLKWSVAVAAAAALVAGFAVFGKTHIERQLIEGSPAANRALVDYAATATVVGDVSHAVEKIFTYRANNLDDTETSAEQVLTGKAKRQYTALFGQLREHAQGKKVSVTTRVVRAGAIHLDGGREGDTAKLLIFLDQVIQRGDGEENPPPAAAQLIVDALRTGGEWKISGIETATGKGDQ